MERKYKGHIAIFIGFVIAALAIALGGVFVYQNRSEDQDNQGVPKNLFQNVPDSSPSLTQVPFKELTVPYLRSRDYNSELSQLSELSQNSEYTSYLTSYDSDGLQVNGLLTLPDGEVPQAGWPAIVFVHGYIPPSLYRTTENYAAYVDYLASRGFVVFKIDLRGHAQSEGVAGGAYFSGDYVIDTLNAHSALGNADFVDDNAVGLWGHSMAGNVIFRSFVADQNIPAIVIWAGAVYTYEDMQELGLNDNSYRPPGDNSERRKRREELRAEHGDFDPERTFWQSVAPTNYLDGVAGAIQINHAVDDNVVDIEYSRGIMDILSGTAIVHELNEYSSGGHNISGSAFSEAMANTAEFFNEHLK